MKRIFAAMLLAALALPAFAHADVDNRRHRLQHRAEGGEPHAMFLLAHMLADGEGGPPDRVAARAWLERAAELEYPEALQELALNEPDPERADALMRAAAHALAHRAHAADRH
ncbi:SEL1-like repeat protein [Telluria mixta]|uniref:SEL1-like repeat protein n=1 Tax=Telluria mixta TaxID=34071 RepID=A0ABT2C622_9BURK|nr:SEL1-like repeat protein [Telluria mixta]MCS0632089.1 SEL1-like repeat protein [Telluria mixta]WEM95237.1 SEL1-like repeat protein [Telluria mixta]